MNKSTKKTLYKLLFIGATLDIFIFLFYKINLINDQSPTLIRAVFGPVLFVPIMLFLTSLIAFKQYAKTIELNRIVLTVGAYILIGYYAAFNLVEIIVQKTFVFYPPTLLEMIAPFLGAYLAARIFKKTIKK